MERDPKLIDILSLQGRPLAHSVNGDAVANRLIDMQI